MDVSNLLSQERRMLGSLRKIAVHWDTNMTTVTSPPDSRLLRQGHPHQAGDGQCYMSTIHPPKVIGIGM